MQYIIIILSIAQLYILSHILRKLNPIDINNTLYSQVKNSIIKTKEKIIPPHADIISPTHTLKIKQLKKELTQEL